MKKFYLYILLFTSLNSFAQNSCSNSLSGYILDRHNNEPLQSASVALPKVNLLVYTDSSGFFKLTGLCHGNYLVTINHFGCDQVSDTLHIDGNVEHNFYPEHHTHEIEGVLISSEEKKINRTQSSVLISQKKLSLSSGESLGSVLKKTNGVTTLSTGANIEKPTIRGMHSIRILIINDGIRQESQQWGTEHAPEIDNYTVNSIELIKGASAVKYGPDAIGGVILLKSKNLPTKKGIEGEANLVGFSNGRMGVASVRLDAGLFKNFGIRALGTFKQGGNINAPNYYLKNTGTKELNFQFTMGYRSSKFGSKLSYTQFNSTVGIFSGAHIGNLTDLETAFNASEPIETADFTYFIDRPYQEIKHQTLKSNTFWQINKKSKLKIDFAFQENHRLEFDKPHAVTQEKNGPQFNFTLNTQTIDISLLNKTKKNLISELGLSGLNQTNIWSGRYFIPNYAKQSAGVYTIEKLKLGKHKVELGVRYDWTQMDVYRKTSGILSHNYHKFSNVSGTIGAIFKLNKTQELKVNVASAWRPPSINELYSDGLHHGAAAIEIGDENLKKESAYNLNLEYSYQKKGFKIQAEPYVNLIENYVYLNPKLPPELTIQGAFPVFQVEQVGVIFYGADITSQLKFNKRFSSKFKTALIRAQEYKTSNYVNGIPAERVSLDLQYDFKKGKKQKNTFINLEFQHIFKQFRVPVNGDFVAPPDAYSLFNLNAGTEVFISKQKLEFSFTINNILNTSYRDYLNRYRYFTDNIGRNFILRIRIPFHTHIKHKHDKH